MLVKCEMCSGTGADQGSRLAGLGYQKCGYCIGVGYLRESSDDARIRELEAENARLRSEQEQLNGLYEGAMDVAAKYGIVIDEPTKADAICRIVEAIVAKAETDLATARADAFREAAARVRGGRQPDSSHLYTVDGPLIADDLEAMAEKEA